MHYERYVFLGLKASGNNEVDNSKTYSEFVKIPTFQGLVFAAVDSIDNIAAGIYITLDKG